MEERGGVEEEDVARVTDERCSVCGTMIHARQNQPLTDDPAVLDGVLEALQQRLDELRAGRRSPDRVRQDLARLCSGCRDILPGISGRADREELIQHFALAIRRIDARVQAMEQDQPPSAEQAPRLSGPGDDVT